MGVEVNKRQGLNKNKAKQNQHLLGSTLKLELFSFGIYIIVLYDIKSASSLYTASSISILLSNEVFDLAFRLYYLIQSIFYLGDVKTNQKNV